MIGKKQEFDPKLYYQNVNLETRVPANHPLRRIQEAVDFDFVRDRVAWDSIERPSID